MNERMTPLAAAVFAVLYPAAVPLAQQATSDTTKLEQVIVTATRRDENLQDVGQSITALSTEDIEKQAFRSVQDVIGALPSVSNINELPGRTNIVMRGISSGSEEFRNDSLVAVYLDDQPMTSISQQVDVRLIDIARIEALPGPQGTLFGSSSEAGTIRYITNKPDPAGLSGQIDAEFGTTKGGEESYDVSGWVNIPVNDNIAVRATGYYSQEGGYVDNVFGLTFKGDRDNSDVVEDDWNDYTTTGGRVAARWTVNPKWEATLSLIAQNGASDGAWETDPALGDNKITRFVDEYRNDDWYQASMNIKGDLGFAELSVTASYFDRKIKYEFDNMAYDQRRSYTYPDTLYDTDYLIGTVFNDQKQSRWAYEVRLTSQGDSRFQWMAGAFYEDVYDWWDYDTLIPGLTSTTAWEAAQFYACYNASAVAYGVTCPLPDTEVFYPNIYSKKIKQKALFGEMTYALTDRWSITGGARWFEYDRHEIDSYQFPKGLPPFPIDATLGRLESSGVSDDYVLKFGTEFHFDDDRMLYFLYSEGFRLGGNNSQRAADTGLIPLTYGPDTLRNYELGLKSQWLDNRLQFNVSLFSMRWDDIHVDQTLGKYWIRGTFNGPKAEQRGIELTANLQLTNRFSLEASLFAANPEYSEDFIYPGCDNTDPDNNCVIEAGSPMPDSSERKYWIATDYKFPRFGSLNGDLWVRWSYSYTSEFWDSINAMQENNRDLLVPSFSTSTLQFGFSHQNGWDTALIVRNLFDENGYGYISGNDYSGSLGNIDELRYKHLRSLQRPRSISLSFSKKW